MTANDIVSIGQRRDTRCANSFGSKGTYKGIGCADCATDACRTVTPGHGAGIGGARGGIIPFGADHNIIAIA